MYARFKKLPGRLDISLRFHSQTQSDIEYCFGISARQLEYAAQHTLQLSRFSGFIYNLLPFRLCPSLVVGRSLEVNRRLSLLFSFLVSLVQYPR